MVEVVKEEVELTAIREAVCSGDEVVVGRVKLGGESSKHCGNGQVKFVVPIERCRIICNCIYNRRESQLHEQYYDTSTWGLFNLSCIARPEVSV